MLDEAKILFSLPPHKNIIRCLGISLSLPALLLEFVKGGNLCDFLDNDNDDVGVLAASAFEKWKNRLDICHQISSGMAAIHHTNIIHLDIKPANILWELTPAGRLKCKVLIIS